MFKTSHCLITSLEDGSEQTIIHINQDKDETKKAGYPFGSRIFPETKRRIDDVLNGKYYKLPFGIRIIKVGNT